MTHSLFCIAVIFVKVIFVIFDFKEMLLNFRI